MARIAGETTQGRALSIMHVGAITTHSAKKGARKRCTRRLCSHRLSSTLSNTHKSIPPSSTTTKRWQIALHGLPLFRLQSSTIDTGGIRSKPDGISMRGEVPNLIGLKHSAHDLSMIRHWNDMGLACFSGFGHLPLPALTMGAVGYC